MAEMRLTGTRIRAGVWEGVLSGSPGTPALEVLVDERVIPGVSVQPIPDRLEDWAVRVPIPSTSLNEGVQTFLINDEVSDETLAHFSIVAGMPVEDDLRAEIDLLRAELDMLKRAVRRHCLECAD